VVWFIYGRPYTIALLVAALVVAQKFQGTGFLTISDVLAATYGRATQVAGGIASFLYALPILAMMGLAALGQVLFGLPLWVGAVVGSLVSVAYVAMGGFWADALTDVAQFTIMCVSLAVALPLILDGVGGFAGVRQALGPEPFSPLGTAPPLYTVAYALTAVSVLVEPLFYQRIFAARDRPTIRKAFLWAVLIWAAYDWATTAARMAGAALMKVGVLPRAEPSSGSLGAQSESSRWAALLRRVFALDVFQCPRCGGRRRIVRGTRGASACGSCSSGSGS
jgi:solute:Na+ symporter, SSS family